MRSAVVSLLLLAWSSTPVSAETPARAPYEGIDHAAACGFFQLSKEFRRAIGHCDQALRAHPSDHDTILNRGSAHFALGNLDDALKDFDAAIQLKPGDPRNFFNRALVHAVRREHQQAIADYDEAIRLMPGLAIAYNNRAHEFEAVGDREKAVADYREAMRLAPALASVIRRNLERLGAVP